MPAKGHQAELPEFMDLVRACIGLEPIPNSPCTRNRVRQEVGRRYATLEASADLEALGHLALDQFNQEFGS